jgi:hypothetical protein
MLTPFFRSSVQERLGLVAFQNMELMRTYGSKWEEITGAWRQ